MFWLILILVILTVLGLWYAIAWAVGYAEQHFEEYEDPTKPERPMKPQITRTSLLPTERERMAMNSTAQEKANQKRAMVRKLLSMGYKMGYQYRRTVGNYDGLVEWQINMKHVNEFFNKHGHVKKDINNMTHTELVQSVTQFQQVLNDFLKRV